MKTVGFIGLGTMGFPMASNLLRRGFPLTVYSRTPSKSEELTRQGARTAVTPAEAARASDVLVTMVSDDAALAELFDRPDGIGAALRPGFTVIDCSTVAPETSRRLAERCREAGADFLDAPVTGSKPAAVEGTLVFMVGGRKETLDAHRDVLLAMGRKIVYMGPSGSGSHAKLAHNAIVGINALGFLEGLSIAAKGGLDPEAFLDVVLNGGAASKQAELKGPKVINRDFDVQFSLNLMLKDLRLAAALAEQTGVVAPILRHARDQFELGRQEGWGDEDLSAMVKWYERHMGVTIQKAREGGNNA